MFARVNGATRTKETLVPGMRPGIERWQNDNVIPRVIQFSMSGVGNSRIC